MWPERGLSDWRGRPGRKNLRHSGKTSIAASGVRQKPAGTHEVNRFIPGFGFNLLHDSMDVVLDGELGQAKAGGAFFIRHSLGAQRHELALPKSQPGFQTSFLVGHDRLLTGLSSNILKESHTEFCRTDRFSLNDAANGGNDVLRRRIIEQITRNAQFHGLQEIVPILIHAKEDNFQLGKTPEQLLEAIPGADRSQRVKKQHVTRGCSKEVQVQFRLVTFPGNRNSCPFLKKSYQSLSQQSVLDEKMN